MINQIAKIHHPDSEMQKLFDDFCIRVSKWKNIGMDRDLPPIYHLKNGNYVIWSEKETSACNQSAWNESKAIQGSGWSHPFEIKPEDKENCLYYNDGVWNFYNRKNAKKNLKRGRTLQGSYFAFHSWWANNYGHTMHDTMPLLAYLKATLHESLRFLMLDVPVIKKIIKALDEGFYNRIEWINAEEVINISGDLFVTVPDSHPCIMAKNLMSHLKDWISASLPKPVERNNIIFYTRKNTTKYRVLNIENEENITQTLKKFLIDNKIDGNLIIFSGKDEDGNVLPIEEQISIFRSAHTIIGPHGTGLSNIMWCDFNSDTPIKLLEFCPGPVGYSSEVQYEFNGYHTVLRGLPIDYHIILYTPQSTANETFVDLSDFNQAIEKMLSNQYNKELENNNGL